MYEAWYLIHFKCSLNVVAIFIIWLLSSELGLLLPASAIDISCQRKKELSWGYLQRSCKDLSF